MLKAMTARKDDDRGFTLVELMVVVLIIGILVAIAIPSFLSARRTAEDTTARANLRNAYSVAKAYQAEHEGNYPADNTAVSSYDNSLPWGDGSEGTIDLTGGSSITLVTDTPSGHVWTATDSSGTLVFQCAAAEGAPACPEA